VLPTTTTATILIVYEGFAQIDGWLDSIDEAILSRRLPAASSPRTRGRDHGRGLAAG
jgi:hypothetical protein